MEGVGWIGDGDGPSSVPTSYIHGSFSETQGQSRQDKSKYIEK